MPDIAMCNDDTCPKRERCYRYTASADEWQSWFAESPRTGKTCDEFIQNRRDTKNGGKHER